MPLACYLMSFQSPVLGDHTEIDRRANLEYNAITIFLALLLLQSNLFDTIPFVRPNVLQYQLYCYIKSDT